MAGTRSSTRNTTEKSSPVKETTVGTKRKPEAEPSPKRDRKAPKKQATLEETLNAKKKDGHSEMKDADVSEETSEAKDASEEVKGDDKDATTTSTTNGNAAKTSTTTDDAKDEAADDVAAKTTATDDDAKPESNGNTKPESNGNTKPVDTGDGAIEQSSQREKQVPSNILEKGIIYFFTRNRVGVEDADSVGDLQRTFFVLRPLPIGAKLGDGAIPDLENNRLFALPKKVFPKSHNDRFMAFVEKSKTTLQDLKDNFFQGSQYETKTQGTRHVDPVTPVAEGVYAITRTEDATSHRTLHSLLTALRSLHKYFNNCITDLSQVVYATTIPREMGEMQQDLGIKDKGSFIISVKNPERSGPAAASLPQKPGFPKEIIEEFRGLAWSEVKPQYLDYEYCQILLIGEHLDEGVVPTTKDKKHDKETPQEELEKLEHEDELRVKHLQGKIATSSKVTVSD
jgi:hypothetical protein